MKIDLEKAYDKVNWKFLEDVLKTVGFGADLVELIMYTVTSPKLSVIWNGERLAHFSPTRGIRQGDPLAPYLFLLCMEVLSHEIQKAVDHKQWVPAKASRSGPGVSHIFSLMTSSCLAKHLRNRPV